MEHQAMMNTINDLHAGFHEFTTKQDSRVAVLGERIAALETAAARPRMPGADGAPSTAARRVLEDFIRTGNAAGFTHKAMSVGTDAAGGFTVPSELANEIARVALAFSPMRKIARVEKVNSGQFEVIVSTNAAGAEWRGETDTRQDTATPTLASVKPPSGELSSVAPITNWLIQDSAYDVARFVIEELGKAHGLAEGAAFVSGTGTNQPKGILSYTLAAEADGGRAFGTIEKMHSGVSASFSADNLIALFFKLAAPYRANATWVMNGATLQALRALKDDQKRYLFDIGADGGPLLLGRPIVEDPNVPAPGASTNSVLVGDFTSGYVVADIGEPTILRDPYTSKGYLKIWGAKRVGGAVLDSNAIKVLTLAV